jgi:hypothetical protein
MSAVQQSVKGNLLAAFRHLLKPLVRLAIKNGVSVREFNQAVKSSYVDAAVKQIGTSGNRLSREAIALMLNVATNEIDELVSPAVGNPANDEQPSTPVAKLLAGWYTDPRTNGPYGVLLDLPFDATVDSVRANTVTFSQLANRYCPSISPRALLEEAMRTECVVSVGKNYYRAVKRSHVPEPLSGANISHFARVVHNICETCERNLRTESIGGKGLFERTIFSDTRITRGDLKLFDKYVRERGQLFADDIDNWLSRRSQPEADDVDAINTGIGLYHFIVNDEDEREFGFTQVS